MMLAAIPALWRLAAGALLGLAVGSFINLLVRRLPLMLQRLWQLQACDTLGMQQPAHERFNLWLPRSHCPHCAHPLAWWENLPLLSFALLRGRCSACGAAIGWRYPLVELGSAALTAALAVQGADLWAVLLLWGLLALALIDHDCGLLPDALTLPLLWLGLLHASADPQRLVDAVWGAAAGYLSLWSVNAIYRLLRRIDGMGGGDFKLFAVLGAWFGWQTLPALLLLASASAAVIALLQLAAGRRRADQALAFGPYLAAAAVLLLLWPQLGAGHGV